jgi:hypothetical protein
VAFGFPPRYAATIDLQLGVNDMACLVEESLTELGWRYYLGEANQYSARTPMSSTMKGGGWESISIAIEEFKGVHIKSQSFLPWHFFDFGKNKDNVETFIQIFSLKSLDRYSRVSNSLCN